ncbi:hypothetical protein [Snodgrassella alvi]|uniref:Uncharacterized protein n=1 Tax=Snodgrassella alvi TaxID=1196083 RepID=A0A2N9XYS0_9NEIS|nr:hypothetical protein [Snodgrassella alvi]PIT54741.1 hypothetical protein BHC49_07905 [Snodgrassella alvi]PIT56069.1 hypothetical protein BHC49_04865 [Snodgrassella alvi]PIT56771.1 hypothetical protein BHC49_04130 [Snodgrassella alvi]PIT56918.1 hypothetical protein BHC49_04085 [Snodgrassella alvi]
MLGLSSLNTTLLATDNGEAAQAETSDGVELIRIGCTVRAIEQSEDLITFTCHVYQKTDSGGDLINIAQVVNPVCDNELLQLGQQVLNPAPNCFMRARYAQGFDGEKYAIRIFVAGVELCNVVRTCEVHFAEGESATASLYLREPCGAIDIYQYYNRQIVIYAQTDKYLYPIFSGVIDMPKIDYSGRLRVLNATKDRSKSVEKLSIDTIHGIGHWAPSIFGEEQNYETKNAQLTDRLSTIPASFDFDAREQAHLTSWLPKPVADWTLSACDVYEANMALEMSSAVSIVNRVEIELHHQFDRLIHREISFSYRYLSFMSDFDYIIRVAAEGPAPKLADVQSAANGGGWTTGEWWVKGTPPPGVYNGVIWKAADYKYDYEPTGEKDENGHDIVNVVQIPIGSDSNLYALAASWKAMRRWKQAIDEKYIIVLQNQESIAIHGEKKEKVTYSINHESDDDKMARNWGSEKHYKRPKGVKQLNGDYTTNIDNVIPGEFANGYRVAVQIGYTRMLESHRQNSITMDCKFLPVASLTHTVHVATKRFNANVKIAAYSHSWDFTSKRGKTTLTGKFFMNPGSRTQTFSEIELPRERPQLPCETFQQEFILNDYIVPYGVDVIEQDPNADKDEDEKKEEEEKDKGNSIIIGKPKFKLYECNGYVRKETGYTFKGTKMKRGIAFRVQMPDIEEKSTDTLDVNAADKTFNLAIPHNEPFPQLTCHKK